MRRRRLVALTLIAALTIAVTSALHSGTTPPGVLVLSTPGSQAVQVALARYVHEGRIARSALRAAVLRSVPPTSTVTSGSAQIEYVVDRRALARRLDRLGVNGGSLEVPRTPIQASIRAPAMAQRETNDCEATSLSILLATTGVNVDQLTLQDELPRSGPVDPVRQGGSELWGDPEEGFVGRPSGGGFGVYERPVAQLALRYHRRLADLTGASPAAVYARLLSGHAVIAWVGLSDGPFGHWTSPDGKPVTVNFGEHAIVLAGIDPAGALSVDNPLDSAPERWSRGQFEEMWTRLGRRALSS